MNDKSKEAFCRLVFSAAFMSALPDSEQDVLWEKAKMENPEHPMLPYFDNIIKGFPVARGFFEKIKQDLL
jgi:hypothetical protein